MTILLSLGGGRALLLLFKFAAWLVRHEPKPDGRTCGWTGCQSCYPERTPLMTDPEFTLDIRGDTVAASQDLTPVVEEMRRQLREKGDEFIRQHLIDNGITVVKPGRTPLAWAIEEMGDCEVEPGGAWCQSHGAYLPSNRKPPYCNDLLDIVDKIERYIS